MTILMLLVFHESGTHYNVTKDNDGSSFLFLSFPILPSLSHETSGHIEKRRLLVQTSGLTLSSRPGRFQTEFNLDRATR